MMGEWVCVDSGIITGFELLLARVAFAVCQDFKVLRKR